MAHTYVPGDVAKPYYVPAPFLTTEEGPMLSPEQHILCPHGHATVGAVRPQCLVQQTRERRGQQLSSEGQWPQTRGATV